MRAGSTVYLGRTFCQGRAEPGEGRAESSRRHRPLLQLRSLPPVVHREHPGPGGRGGPGADPGRRLRDDSEKVGTELASRDPRILYRRHLVNRGHIATYNEGIEWAEGDYLLVLSADDLLTPGALGGRRA